MFFSCESIKTEEASDTGGDEPVEDDPPPEITNLNDYKDIFQTHRERKFLNFFLN